jgi:Helicase conserved C-terminal domain
MAKTVKQMMLVGLADQFPMPCRRVLGHRMTAAVGSTLSRSPGRTRAGVSAGYIDAYTPSAERKQIERQFHAGEITVVCNVGCLTTGADWDVRCIILARPTKSEMLFVQIIGRGLRTATGKLDCLILDHSDTHARLGSSPTFIMTNSTTGASGGNQSPGTNRCRSRARHAPS